MWWSRFVRLYTRAASGLTIILRTSVAIVALVGVVILIGELYPVALARISPESDKTIDQVEVEAVKSKPSTLFPAEEPALPRASDIAGRIIANIEEDAARQMALIEGENQARLEGVKAMLKSREQTLDLEIQARMEVLQGRLAVTSTANQPKLVRAFVQEGLCLYDPAGPWCSGAEATSDEMVAFFNHHIQNAPEYHMLFDNKALQKAAGYDPETGTWDNGSRTYLQE